METLTFDGFRIDDLNPTLSENARQFICDLTLAWASYDVAVSYWTVIAFNLPLDRGALFLGNMDTKAKLDKLVSL